MPIVVTISRTNGMVQGEIDRKLLVIGGSISLPEHRGPMSVPDALTKAQELAAILKPAGGSGVYIQIAEAQLWNETWGELK
jgi:hypothetical protein